MNQNHITKLLGALSAERVALRKFIHLLEQEQGLLVENNTDQLLEFAEQKSAQAINLSKLAEFRRNLLRENISELTAETIHAWLKTTSTEGLAMWQEIRTLAERAQQINHTNGELIQMKLRHNQKSLAVLTGAVDKANLYGPDGQTSFSPGSGRSLGSG
ncbi:MAG: flagellar protein FlgN [Gallionella sp.]|nr:flagellar protein FlgN [Gallionella sp.]